MYWHLEVRTEDIGAGSIRMGTLMIRGGFDSLLVCGIPENDDAISGSSGKV